MRESLQTKERFSRTKHFVPSAGIEPASSPSEGDVLSIELRGQLLLKVLIELFIELQPLISVLLKLVFSKCGLLS